MKEIMMPVLVLDDDCRRCEFLDVHSEIKSQMWADEQVVDQDIQLKCSEVYKCRKLMKRMKSQG